MARHYLSVDDLSPAELIGLLELSGKVKADPEAYAERLRGRSVALVFEKPSTRTRVSFEVGVAELGAHPLVISSTELQLGRGETIEDTGRVLSRYVDAIVLRTFEQERLELLASASSVPVVNSLSDFEHPCQALADLFTVRERLGGPGGTHARVLRGRQQRRALAAARGREGRHEGARGDTAGVRADPAGGEAGDGDRGGDRRRGRGAPRPGRRGRPAPTSCTRTCGRAWGRRTRRTNASWCSAAYQLDQKLVDLRRSGRDRDALPARPIGAWRSRAEVIDGPRSAVWDQAENRLHTQKALLLMLFDLA